MKLTCYQVEASCRNIRAVYKLTQETGNVTTGMRLDLAWSRDQASKVYVQHKLWERKERFWTWMNHGAHIYVCGDAINMAKDVEQTILTIARSFGVDAEAWLKQLELDLRYQKDVY